MDDTPTTESGFRELGLSEPVLKALENVGYETPTPIQSAAIPHLLAGKDLFGQAQTGTGKTAAFALPCLSIIDLKKTQPQALVLTPTRELALQVAEAFQRYASQLRGFHVLPIYGGQGYSTQLRRLMRGVHVVVGTPGRVMDHLRRGTLNLEELRLLVLDEGDEMLRMGFVDDVEWILERTPAGRQIALFSATLPTPIRRIAKKHLREPEQIVIKSRTATVESTNQRYWMVSGFHKLDALTRILEAETFDAVLIFVRTKVAAVEISENLKARGYASEALNGDVPQRQREQIVGRLKSGGLNIVVATDVAARGLDVHRISHVINFDIPYDTETYVHRIGRTGRMGRRGEAILFVTPRERRMLRSIERATKQKIQLMRLPSTEDVNDKRIARFRQRITDTMALEGLELYTKIIHQYQQDHDVPSLEIAAALAKIAQGDTPLLLPPEPERKTICAAPPATRQRRMPKEARGAKKPPLGWESFRMEVGHQDGVRPANIVGAIANEAELDSRYIGRIDIYDHHSTVDLPEGMPHEILRVLQRTFIAGKRLCISRLRNRNKSGKNRMLPKKTRMDGKKKRLRKQKSRTGLLH